jgi:hypothetical protein
MYQGIMTVLEVNVYSTLDLYNKKHEGYSCHLAHDSLNFMSASSVSSGYSTLTKQRLLVGEISASSNALKVVIIFDLYRLDDACAK